MKLKICSFLFFVVLLSSCSKDQLEVDNAIIEAYLAEHNIQAKAHPSGIYYALKQEGIGEQYPNLSSDVTIEYKGYLTNHTIFDEVLTGNERTIHMGDLVEGLQESISLLKKQGAGLFLIPSDLAYHSTVRAGIPSHAVLIFEIKLVDFN